MRPKCIPPLTDDDARRFWSLVDRRGPGECWPWRGKINNMGYGVFRVSGGVFLAHRVSASIASILDPPSLIRHTCDNPPCQNPAHLIPGTQRDNMRDAIDRGRHSPPPHWFGRDHPSIRIPDDDVVAIFIRYHGGGISQRSLAREYGVTQAMVSLIVRGETRKYLSLSSRHPVPLSIRRG